MLNCTSLTEKPELDKLWGTAVGVPGTHGVHCVRTLCHGKVTVAAYSEQVGKPHLLIPEEGTATDDHNTEEETSDNGMEPQSDDHYTLSVAAGKWYAVYWEPTQFWYIGQALYQDEKDLSKWVFSFIEQTHPGTNGFKPIKDREAIHKDFVFAEVEAPAPSSSSRTTLLKLTADDFISVQQKFEEL